MLVLGWPAAAQRRGMIVLVVPGLKSSDLADSQGLHELIRSSAVGWMNSRSARRPGQQRDTEQAGYLTLGSGSRAAAPSNIREITPAILRQIKNANARLDHPVRIGLFGDLTHAGGLRTAVFGDEDAEFVNRSANLLAI